MPLFLLIWLPLAVLIAGVLIVLRPGRDWTWLGVITLLLSFSIWIALPSNEGIVIDLFGDDQPEFEREVEIRQGLDLAGGLKVLLEADLPEGVDPTEEQLSEARRIIEQRIDSLGALEPVIQVQGSRRIIVELPGYDNPEAAIDLIRDTAQLEFIAVPSSLIPPPGAEVLTSLALEQQGIDPATITDDYVFETVMTGDILTNATVTLDQLGNPAVSFTLSTEGSQQFGDYTRDHRGEILGIVLDGVLLSSPQINAEIRGAGVIEGEFNAADAETLATQLRYGALPVPLRVDSTSTVGPTLGQISVQASIRAGLIGIGVVLLFMLIYYRVPGLAAALALLSFAVINLMIYKLVPVTLTLPAITGFLISIGTAVDGNILIFERMKEELRAGKRVPIAVETGFNRAWVSIRDSNLSTLLICIVLYLFGTSFGAGPVRGFAVTLALGLGVNMFTAIIVTRTFLGFLLRPFKETQLEGRRWLLGL